jgi:hypothetical protein
MFVVLTLFRNIVLFLTNVELLAKIKIKHTNQAKYERGIINYKCTIHQIFSVIKLRHLTKIQIFNNVYDLKPL